MLSDKSLGLEHHINGGLRISDGVSMGHEWRVAAETIRECGHSAAGQTGETGHIKLTEAYTGVYCMLQGFLLFSLPLATILSQIRNPNNKIGVA